MVRRKAESRPAPGSRSVNFEIVVNSRGESRSMFEENIYPSVANIDEYRPPKSLAIEVARKLQKNGITVHHIGDLNPFSLPV